jgi:pilus assembly protein CpaB
LTPSDAERAVLASQQGTIHFILRSGSDADKPKDTPVQLSQLIPGTVPVPAPHSYSAGPRIQRQPDMLTVQTISGDKMTTDSFTVKER